jgi:hypothetical protein
VAEGSRVDLPPYVRPPFEVYVNGVLQGEGRDYVLRPGAVVFERSLAREGKLGFMTWLAMWLGIAGSYRAHETVDIAYRAGGEARVAAELPVVADDGAA